MIIVVCVLTNYQLCVNYAQPQNLDEALGLLASKPWAILAGGTDFYPAALERPMAENILDIHSLRELQQISLENGQWRIGAGVTWSGLIAADLPCAFDALKLAAREVGSVQIQNRATLVGNLCNASPAADGVPPLLILDAQVELASRSGRRILPLQQFILGNRDIARQPDEIVTAIVIPAHRATGRSSFIKLGARKYLVISISMVAARVAHDAQGLITDAALSVGSCSLVAQRLATLERELIGQSVSMDLAELLRPEHLVSLLPIDDVRSTASYRRQASLELVRRALSSLPGVAT